MESSKRRGDLAIHQSNRKSIILQGKVKKWTQDGNLLEGAEMLAVHPSIKPENQSFIKENEKIVAGWKSSRRGMDASCSHPSIKP